MAYEKQVPDQISVSKYNHVKVLSCEMFAPRRGCGSLVSDKQKGLEKAELVKGELLLKTKPFPLVYPIYLF